MMCSTTDYAQDCFSHPPEYSHAYLFCRVYPFLDNNQQYNHTIKLPEVRFMVIRLFRHFTVSGSVTRTRNNHIAVIRCCAPVELKKIRNSGFSDLQYEGKILLHMKQ